MLDSYNPEALGAVFVARAEASRLGSSAIDTEHLLLGVLRAGKTVVWPVLTDLEIDADEIVKEVEKTAQWQRDVPTSDDLPLTLGAKRVLDYAEKEVATTAATPGPSQVGAEHILIGLLRAEQGYASAILLRKGLQVEKLRDEIRKLKSKRP